MDWLKRFLAWLDTQIHLQATVVVPPPPPAPNPSPSAPTGAQHLERLCLAIKQYEGWYQGSRSYKNNNPGNCRYSPVGYLSIYGTVGRDDKNFAIFKDYATGWLYLHSLIKEHAKSHPSWSLVTFFKDPIHGYAPSRDGNNPDAYATFVGKYMSVNPFAFQLKELL